MLCEYAARGFQAVNAPVHPPLGGEAISLAQALNRRCACRTLDTDRLRRHLETDPSLAGLADEITRTRPHLVSSTAVFLSPEDLVKIGELIAAIERVVALPGYRAAVMAAAPAIAKLEFGPQGVLFGFDFHLSASGPKLIEINTNAGGVLVNAALARAQAACCEQAENDLFVHAGDPWRFDEQIYAMFEQEWRSQRRGLPLGCIAIVDDQPGEQYLHPEFRLFERLFARFGARSLIADARALEYRDGRLWHADTAIDLVYNRLTDFYFEESGHSALRAAYEAGATVVTPHPRAHALYANKRNLEWLGNAAALQAFDVPDDDRALLLEHIPATEPVTEDNAQRLWSQRRGYFFKPVSGYGGKAAYRGDKLTHRVWSEIRAQQYVAQALVLPSGRIVAGDGPAIELKLDVRAYAYAGTVQLVAARLYQGQTTNFRTPGGGFAPVFVARPDI